VVSWCSMTSYVGKKRSMSTGSIVPFDYRLVQRSPV
jgi:hypothetical protein